MERWKDGWSLAPNFSIDVHAFSFHIYTNRPAVSSAEQLTVGAHNSNGQKYQWWSGINRGCAAFTSKPAEQRKKTTQAGVSQKYKGTPGGYSHKDTQVNFERKSLPILRNVIFRKTHTFYLGIFWWPNLFRIDLMQEYSIWRSSGKELCITE